MSESDATVNSSFQSSGASGRSSIVEGLVMDKRFLENIREERNLLDVLRAYGVRYYVSTNAEPSANGCFDLSEPKVAGPRSPRMRATLCKAPVKSFASGQFGVWVFDLQ